MADGLHFCGDALYDGKLELLRIRKNLFEKEVGSLENAAESVAKVSLWDQTTISMSKSNFYGFKLATKSIDGGVADCSNQKQKK